MADAAVTEVVPSTAAAGEKLPGMGAIRAPKGVAFRVWAPHADTVAVVGTFNYWDPAAHPLEREEGGTWYGLVPEATAGDEYRFTLRRGEETFQRADPRARKMTNSVGNAVIWWPEPVDEPRFEAPTLDRMAIYEMHVGSFHVKAGEAVGTFDSAIEKLDHLRDLGINTIEVMPVSEFAGDLSWGYNPAHPYAVESAYGGPEGLQRFVKAAHERGLAVILDVVYNHFGPSDLSLWRFDGWSENGLGGIYFYNDWRASTPWGDSRPDYGRGEVRSYLRDNALMWIEEYGLDGLRWDMTLFIRTCKGTPGDPADDLKEGWGLLQWINEEVHGRFPRAVTIAEDLRDSEWLVKGAGAGGAGFNAQWDAAFVHPVREVMIVARDEHRNLDAVISSLKNKYDGDAFKRVVYSESHDEVANGRARMPTEIGDEVFDGHPARKRSTLAAALVMTAPGVPMLFQGQEFLENEWFRDSVPLDWGKRERFAGIFALYRDLLGLRARLLGLQGQHVETHHVDHERKILAYQRWRDPEAGDHVLVVANFSHEPVSDLAIGVPAPGLWRAVFNSDAKAYSDDFADHPSPDVESIAERRDGCEQHIVTGVGPYSVVIFAREAADDR